MEMWDLYDKNRKPLKRTVNRCDPQAMNPDEYHIIVEVWTVNQKGEILLTQRDKAKQPYPGMWENTGGSVLAGERSDAGAARELKEETGIEAKPANLKLIYMRREEHAFLDTYMYICESDAVGVSLRPGETCDSKWVSVRELENMIANGFIAKIVVDRLYDYRNVFEWTMKQRKKL